MILRRVIMDWVRAAVGRLDAEIIAQKIAGDQVTEGPGSAAINETGFDLAVAAAVDGHRAARRLNTAFGTDVDDAGGTQPVFCRQSTVDQAHGIDEARIQCL